ncbi:hypothetical protein [Streptomyces sp. NRRL S-350]|uniref:hypothetical protein n=1 Tax=Streptomyces sp. NRRL S-350 TaxID=1463902 RepID=UPI0006898063|nr:hypothetical protein [Streptomyces sp. NRRL S-350]
MDSTGVPAVDVFLIWGGALTLAAAVGALAWKAVRGALRLGGKIEQFIDDWNGEPERPGVPARLGVMERVGGIEDRMAGIENRVARVEEQMNPNHGSSLRDAVDLANRRLSQLCPAEADCDPPPAPSAP